MAIKKALNKKKEPVKRAVKRTPATAVDAFVDETVGEMDLSAVEPNLDPTAVEVDFAEAPLTPDQIAERDALAGSNAAAAANNTTIPQQQAVQRSAQNFKDTVAYKEFMALPLDERRKLIDEDQAVQKKKMSVKKK